MQQAVDDEFTGTAFTRKFKKATVTYNSSTLTSDLKMIGNQSVNLDYLSSAKVCQFNFQIYEVSSTLTKLVTRANYTDRHNVLTQENKQISIVYLILIFLKPEIKSELLLQISILHG